MSKQTRLATTIISHPKNVPGAIDVFYLDGRMNDLSTAKEKDITLDRTDEGFYFALFASTELSRENNKIFQEKRKRLEDISALTKYDNRIDIDTAINDMAENAVHMTGRLSLRSEDNRAPYYTGIMVKNAELAAITMGSGLAYLYRDDILYPLTEDDFHMEAIDTLGNPVENFDIYGAGRAGTIRYSNISQLQIDDCIIICTQEVMEVIGQKKMLEILDEVYDQEETVERVRELMEESGKDVPYQFCMSFVEDIISNRGRRDRRGDGFPKDFGSPEISETAMTDETTRFDPSQLYSPYSAAAAGLVPKPETPSDDIDADEYDDYDDFEDLDGESEDLDDYDRKSQDLDRESGDLDRESDDRQVDNQGKNVAGAAAGLAGVGAAAYGASKLYADDEDFDSEYPEVTNRGLSQEERDTLRDQGVLDGDYKNRLDDYSEDEVDGYADDDTETYASIQDSDLESSEEDFDDSNYDESDKGYSSAAAAAAVAKAGARGRGTWSEDDNDDLDEVDDDADLQRGRKKTVSLAAAEETTASRTMHERSDLVEELSEEDDEEGLKRDRGGKILLAILVLILIALIALALSYLLKKNVGSNTGASDSSETTSSQEADSTTTKEDATTTTTTETGTKETTTAATTTAEQTDPTTTVTDADTTDDATADFPESYTVKSGDTFFGVLDKVYEKYDIANASNDVKFELIQRIIDANPGKASGSIYDDTAMLFADVDLTIPDPSDLLDLAE